MHLFKSATGYRLSEPLTTLALLDECPPKECGPGQMLTIGWENPKGKDEEHAFYDMDGYTMLCMVKVEKVLKPAAINRETKLRAEALSDYEARTLGRKEITEIKEQVIFDALPNALSEEKRVYAYIDWTNNLLIVDQHSVNKCDEFTSELRKVLGSLPVVPLHPAGMPETTMDHWLFHNSQPPHIKIKGDIVFKNPSDLSQTVKGKSLDVESHVISGAFEEGMTVQEMALSEEVSTDNFIDFTITDTVAIKGISFSGELLANDDDHEDIAAEYAAITLINCDTISKVLLEMFALFGGFAEA